MSPPPLRAALLACCAALPLAAGACAPRLHVEPVVDMNGERVTATQESADPYGRGKGHLRAGRPGLALKEFRTALREARDPVMVLNGIAVAYDQLGRFDLAERYYHRALAQNPNSPETLNNLGYSAYRQGKVTQARRYIERAQRMSPGDPVVLANLDLVGGGGVPDRTERLADRDGAGSPAAAPSAWIERTNAAVQTIVTRPDPELAASAAAHGVHPALVGLAAPVPAPTRAALPVSYARPEREPANAAEAGSAAIMTARARPGEADRAPAMPAALPRFDEFAVAARRPLDALAVPAQAAPPLDDSSIATPLQLFDEFATLAEALPLFERFAAAAPLQLFDEFATLAAAPDAEDA